MYHLLVFILLRLSFSVQGSSPAKFCDSDFNYLDKNISQPIKLSGGADLGYYYASLHVGTPAQPQTLIVDTGSALTAFPCTGCGLECGFHINNEFASQASTSFKTLTKGETISNYVHCHEESEGCKYNQSYHDGSRIGGSIVQDYVGYGDNINQTKQKLLLPFGCTDRETHQIYMQDADGILGLGPNSNSKKNPPSLIDSLGAGIFSLCLDSNKGGYLNIGAFNSKYHHLNEKIQYAQLTNTNDQFALQINRIKANNGDLAVAGTTLAYIRSGTFSTYLPHDIFLATVRHLCLYRAQPCGFKSYTYEGHNLCWIWNDDKLPQLLVNLPTFQLDIGECNALYEWQPKDYIFKQEDNVYCAAILEATDNFAILGSSFMKGHDILFDKTNHVLGFISADCGDDDEPDFRNNDDEPNNYNWGFTLAKVCGVVLLVVFAYLAVKRILRTRYLKLKEEQENSDDKA